jgi:hypothetical protein
VPPSALTSPLELSFASAVAATVAKPLALCDEGRSAAGHAELLGAGGSALCRVADGTAADASVCAGATVNGCGTGAGGAAIAVAADSDGAESLRGDAVVTVSRNSPLPLRARANGRGDCSEPNGVVGSGSGSAPKALGKARWRFRWPATGRPRDDEAALQESEGTHSAARSALAAFGARGHSEGTR